MSQTSEELLNRINAALGVLQDAQEEAVEAVRDVAVHKTDPQAHGEIIAAAVEAAVSDALGGTSGGGGSTGEDGEQLADRLSALENRFDGSGMLLAKNMPLTDAVNSDTGTLAASDRAVKTLHDRLSALSGEGIPADSRMWIGVPRYWRSATLPPNHCWANGDFISFADWPELKAVHDAGGFEGLLLDWDADGPTQAANLGRWRPDAAEPTGLFTPNLVGQFLRGWGQGAKEGAGAWHGDEIRNIVGEINPESTYFTIANTNMIASGAFAILGSNTYSSASATSDRTRPKTLRFDASRSVPTGVENVPQHVWQPCILYLGRPAAA